MLIPEKIIDLNSDTNNIKPGLTFGFDFEKGRKTGKIDGLEAVKQAVFLILATDYEFSPIYQKYGVKIVDLIGQDFNYIISELKRRITEALLSDDRIMDVNNFSYEQNLDSMIMRFNVVSIYGDFETERGL